MQLRDVMETCLSKDCDTRPTAQELLEQIESMDANELAADWQSSSDVIV